MAWNKPGSNDENPDPWGGGKRNQGPPDLDKILSQFLQKLRAFFKSGSSPKIPNNNNSNWQPARSLKETGFSISFIVAILVLAWALSGLFIVNPAEQAVILRFGKFADTLNPGLHWMARFIDTKYLVDVRKVYSFSIQSDFLTKSAEQGDLPNPIATDKKPVLPEFSGDKSKNLVNVEMTVQYHIKDPKAYLFNVANPDETIKEVASGALSDVVGTMKLDDVLTTGRETLSLGVLKRLTAILATYQPGLAVVAVTLRKVQAPDQVQAAFNDVNTAEQDKATYIQQAQAYASKVVPLAQGVAARTLADANGYQQQAILSAQAQVSKYQAILSVYKTSPETTRERMYLETMQNIFTNTSKILVDSSGSNNILYLPLDKIMESAKQNEVPMLANDAAPANTGPVTQGYSGLIASEVK